MAITYASVIYPAGRIHPDLFPERSTADLQTDVTAWITEAYALARVDALDTEAAKDAAATKWVEYRAFDLACITMAANPASAQLKDQGASRYDKDQRETICGLAAKALEEFNDLAPEVEPDSVTAGTRTVRHQFVW